MIDFKNMDRRRVMGLAGMTAASSLILPHMSRPAFGATPLAAVKEEEAVIGFGHVGPISDEGWTWSHHQGLEAVKGAFPKAKYLEVENIPCSADCTRIYRPMVPVVGALAMFWVGAAVGLLQIWRGRDARRRRARSSLVRR